MKMSGIKAEYLVDGKRATMKEYFQAMEVEFAAVKTRWNQDTDLIGRILRAHLFVEHYVLEYLREENPKLGSLDDARLSFSQKVALLSSDNHMLEDTIPGIKHLNKIRNRLAHNLQAAVTKEDAAVFLALPYYKAMRDASQKNGPKLSDDPLAILEHFAEYSGIALARSNHSVKLNYAEPATRP